MVLMCSGWESVHIKGNILKMSAVVPLLKANLGLCDQQAKKSFGEFQTLVLPDS